MGEETQELPRETLLGFQRVNPSSLAELFPNLTPEDRIKLDGLVEQFNDRAGQIFIETLDKNPKLRDSMAEMIGVVGQQAEKGLDLMDRWQEAGLLGKLKITPQIIKAGLSVAMGSAFLRATTEQIRDDAMTTMRNESGWSPKQIESFIKDIGRAGLAGNRPSEVSTK